MKYCKDCIKEIEPAASKCPYCRSPQRPLARFLSSPYANMLIFPVAVVALWFGMGVNRDNDVYEPGGLTVSQENIELLDTDCGLKLVYLGEVSNSNDFAFQDLHFNLEAINEQGKLVEAFSENRYTLVVPPGGKVKFKVEGKVNNSFVLPSKVNVKIVKAEKI